MLFKKKERLEVRPESGGHTNLKPKPDEDPEFHKYRVEYRRDGCVGGDICTFIDPKHFVMNKEDGKADLVGATQEGDKFVMEIFDPTMIEPGGELRRAADCCPAGVIRVIRIKTGEKVAGH